MGEPPEHNPDLGPCLEWMSTKTLRGYGQASIRGVSHSAHRWAWIIFMGEPPKGYVVDHLCRNRGCVNIEHLEPVPPAVNAARQVWKSGKRACA